jgi:LacI family transcriptional regulator
MRAHKNVLLALGRYNPKIQLGVARFAGHHSWHLNAEMAYYRRLPRGWKGDGIITALDEQGELLEFVLAAGVPVVDLSIIREEVPLPRVVGDQHFIGRLAAEHFLERGFRHFACFSTTNDAVTRLRLRGFSETLAHDGLSAESWIFQAPTRARRDEWTLKCEFLVRRLKSIRKPAAVFAFRDADAANVLDAADDAKLAVPEEIAILGTDNSEMICESVRVPLSSINHDLEGIGYEGAALLHRLMQGAPTPPHPRLIPPKGLTIRQSTDALAVNHEPTRLALKFLHDHYQRRSSPDDAAAVSGLSRRNLERAFRHHLGRSVSDYLAALRLGRAKELLLRTNLPIADVAAQTGFSTQQYFNNVFRQAAGKTPRRFRLQRRAV